MATIQEHLISLGFKKDNTCPDAVNRWEKSDGRIDGPYVIGRTYWVSITLSADGSTTKYGIINFYGDYGWITKSRKFTGEMSASEIDAFIEKNATSFAAIVRTSPYTSMYHQITF